MNSPTYFIHLECQPGYYLNVDAYCVQLNLNPQNWANAQLACHALSQSLMTIRPVLIPYLNYVDPGPGGAFWIGAHCVSDVT